MDLVVIIKDDDHLPKYLTWYQIIVNLHPLLFYMVPNSWLRFCQVGMNKWDLTPLQNPYDFYKILSNFSHLERK